MLLLEILNQVSKIVQPLVDRVKLKLKAWTKPVSETLVIGTVSNLLKSKPVLVAEKAFLRQQLVVLKRQVKQPKLTAMDRGLLVVLASRVCHWKNALLICQTGHALALA